MPLPLAWPRLGRMRGFRLHSTTIANPAGWHDDATPPAYLQLRSADLDPGIDPTRDLYTHVNGRWRAATVLPGGHHCWDAFSVLQERSLHEQAHIVTQLAAHGPWRGDAAHTVGTLWRSAHRFLSGDEALPAALGIELARIARLDHADMLRRYVMDRHARGWPVLFEFDVQPDFSRPEAQIICLAPGGLGLPDAALYGSTDELALRWQEAYRAYAASVFRFLGDSPAQAGAQAEAVLAIEARLAAATPSRDALNRDITLHQRRVTVTEADSGNARFCWREFLHTMGIRPPEYISLPHPAFHACWQRMLHEIPLHAWRSYLRFHTVDSLADALHDALAQARHRYRHGMRGDARSVPAWQRVLRNIEQQAGASLGQCYLDNVGRDTTPVIRICESLRDSLRRHITRCHWMGGGTREAALAKLQALRFRIGGDANAPLHPMLSESGWVDNLLTLRGSQHRQKLRRLRQPVDRDAWRLTPQTTNACYDPVRNTVEIPAALLRPPFFHGYGEHASSQGGIGAVIAHEMMHAFDNQGSRFDATGTLRGGWKLGDHLRFGQRATALAEFIARAPGVPRGYDAQRHLSENMADLGGLAMAFDAMPAGSSADDGRRFFHSWAACWRQLLSPDERAFRQRFDTHAPAAVRVNAAAAAIPAFGKLFGRSPGTGFTFW